MQKRFAKTAAAIAEHQDMRVSATRERLAGLLALSGEERALDVGTGAGELALALAPLVASVVGLDIVPEMLEQARRRAPANVVKPSPDRYCLKAVHGTNTVKGPSAWAPTESGEK